MKTKLHPNAQALLRYLKRRTPESPKGHNGFRLGEEAEGAHLDLSNPEYELALLELQEKHRIHIGENYTITLTTKKKTKPKVRLDFMIVPEQLATLAYVPNRVKLKVVDPQAIFLMGLLGESGKRLVKAGIEIYFTRAIAQKLIDKKIAIEVP